MDLATATALILACKDHPVQHIMLESFEEEVRGLVAEAVPEEEMQATTGWAEKALRRQGGPHIGANGGPKEGVDFETRC